MTILTATKAQALPDNPGHRLRPDAAAAWIRACAAAGFTPELTDSLRPYEVQERIFRQRYVKGNHRGRPGYTTDVRTWRGQPWTRRAGTAAAAVPGTSNHGQGLAVDVRTRRVAGTRPAPRYRVFTSWNDPDRLAFLRAARPHGWDDTEGRAVNELWHFTYYPARDRHRQDTAQTILQTPTRSRLVTINLALPVIDMRTPHTTPAPGVALLQGVLLANGSNPSGLLDGTRQPTGIAGPRTRERLLQYQRENGLQADAICGPKTWTKLLTPKG